MSLLALFLLAEPVLSTNNGANWIYSVTLLSLTVPSSLDYDIQSWTATHGSPLSCQQSSLVDRDDYAASPVVTCPLPTCRGQWCKDCNHRVDPTVGPHSCDGQQEMDNYIRQKNLKRCPGMFSGVATVLNPESVHRLQHTIRENYGLQPHDMWSPRLQYVRNWHATCPECICLILPT